MSPPVDAIIKVRDRSRDGSLWLFPAPTASGHIEPSSLKKQHAKACRLAKIEPFDLYTFRHTCLTRWAPHMDVFTLQYLPATAISGPPDVMFIPSNRTHSRPWRGREKLKVGILLGIPRRRRQKNRGPRPP